MNISTSINQIIIIACNETTLYSFVLILFAVAHSIIDTFIFCRKIDDLEFDEEFSKQVKHIKKLQSELCELRTHKDKYEKELRLKTFTLSSHGNAMTMERMQESVLDYQKKALVSCIT